MLLTSLLQGSIGQQVDREANEAHSSTPGDASAPARSVGAEA
jgi:hypothetical protein